MIAVRNRAGPFPVGTGPPVRKTPMKTPLTAITCLLLVATAHATAWSDRIAAGPQAVGFETITATDYSRRYHAAGTNTFGPRPMEIGVWYPAGAEGDARAAGHFPLVLYAAAQGSNGHGNERLCEALASYGFVVATVASKGAYSRDMPFNAEGAEAQFRDLEFVYGALHDYPHVQHDNVSVFGFSFGGLNMVPFAMRHGAVRAMVALDGSIPLGMDIIADYGFLDLAELRTPLLAFIGDKAGIESFTPLLEQAPLAEAYLIETDDLIHDAFSSENLNQDRYGPDERDVFVAMADLTVAFIRKQARDEGHFDALLAARDEAFFPAMKHRSVQAEPRVGRNEFIAFAQSEGLDAAIAVYEETKRDFPGYRLFAYDAFRDIGYRFMHQEDYGAAVRAFRTLIDAYPDEADSHRRLGEALMMAGQYDEARDYLTRGLAIDPDSPALQDILRILDEKDGHR